MARIAENHRALITRLESAGMSAPSIADDCAGANPPMRPSDLFDEVMEFVTEFCDPDKPRVVALEIDARGMAVAWRVAPSTRDAAKGTLQ